MSRKVIKVAAGIIERRGLILVARKARHKSNGGQWEFPGGKIEDGESPENCITREIKEELGMVVEPICILGTNLVKLVQYDLELLGIFCKTNDEVQFMVDHDRFEWVKQEDIPFKNIVKADLPLLQMYKTYKNKFTGFVPLS